MGVLWQKLVTLVMGGTDDVSMSKTINLFVLLQ